jgi:SAM-dependent methyltransferase
MAGGSFASAVSNSVLEHISDVQPVVEEVGRLVRHGGSFVITVPNPGYLTHLSGAAWLERIRLGRVAVEYRHWFQSITRVHHLDWEHAWAQRLRRGGFELERSLRYFSPKAMKVLEWGHLFGLPSLASRRLTGRWILAPTSWNLWLTARLVRPYYDSPVAGDGVFTLYLARRR